MPSPNRIISSSRTGWDLGNALRDLRAHRELLRMMVARDLAIRYHHTVLGLGWVVLQPLMLAGVFSFVIARVPGHGSDSRLQALLTSLCGLIPWTMVGRAVAEGGRALSNQAHIITKVYFPREILPLACTLTAAIDTVVVLAIALGLASWLGLVAPAALWCVPLALAIAVTASLGIALGLAGFDARFKDVRYTLPFLGQLLLLASPVVYPLGVLGLSERAAGWMGLNPLAAAAELMRVGLAGGDAPVAMLAITGSVSALALLAGASLVFRRLSRDIGDML